MNVSNDIEFVIGAASITVYPSSTLIQFSDGLTIAGLPEDTDAYRTTAFKCGYGNDTTALCIDHEIVHIALAHWLGLDSPTMKAVRYDRLGDDHDLRQLEEAAVLAIQHYARAAGRDLISLFSKPVERA